MTVNYTTLLGLAQPVTGTEAGAWGDVVNNYITSFLDASVAGTQTISGSQTAVTLSVTNGSALVTAGSGATGSAQFQIINCTGNPGGLLTITAPASSRQYIIINSTSTSQSVKIVGSGPTTGVTLVSGEKAHVAWNGSDFVKIATQNGSGTFTTVNTTNLEVTNIKAKDGTASITLADSTGVASFTANPVLSGGTQNGVLYLNASKVATSGSALTFDGTNFTFQSAISLLNNDGSGNKAILTPFVYGGSGATGTLVLSSTYGNANQQRIRVGVGGASAISFDIDTTEVARITTTGLKSSIAGSNSDPVFSNTSDTNTGIFFPAADKLGFVAGGGADQMVLTTTGLGLGTATPAAQIQVGSNTGTMPSNTLLALRGSSVAPMRFFGTDGNADYGSYIKSYFSSGQLMVFGTRNNTTDTDTLYLKDGNVGIGTATPAYKLEAASSGATNISVFDTSTTLAADVGVLFRSSFSALANANKIVSSVVGAPDNATGGRLVFSSTSTAGTLTERARIDASGTLILRQSSNAANTSVSFNTTVQNALTLDSDGDLGIGVASPGQKLEVAGAITSSGALTAHQTSKAIVAFNSGSADFRSYGAVGTVGQISFYQGSGGSAPTNTMTLSSDGTFRVKGTGNAGTTDSVQFSGSAPPSALILDSSGNLGVVLNLSAGNNIYTTAGTTGKGFFFTDGTAPGNNHRFALIRYDTVGAGAALLSAYGPIAFEVGATSGAVGSGTIAARFDTSGNLGLGVTPSAWGSTIKGVVQSTYSGYSLYTDGTNNNQMGIVSNAYYNGANWTYYATSTATLFQQKAGAFYWYNAPSGSGFGTAATSLTAASNGVSYTIVSVGSTDFTLIGAANNNVGTVFTKSGGTGTGTGTVSQNITFTQAMTLDASGNLVVGDTSANANSRATLVKTSSGAIATQLILGNSSSTDGTGSALDFSALSGYGTTTGRITSVRDASGQYSLRFSTFGPGGGGLSETARITSGGYFKASDNGTYVLSTGAYHEIRQTSGANEALYVTNAAASITSGVGGMQIYYSGAAPNGTGAVFLYCQDNAALRASIRSNGGLANFQSNNVDLSDIRTKTDINPLGSYWNKIAGLEIVTYKYKDQTHDDLNIGVIAQQVEQVAPEFVDPDGFGETPEDGVPLKTIYNKDLTFAAIKALQEAMTRIEQLEAKVASLESKGA